VCTFGHLVSDQDLGLGEDLQLLDSDSRCRRSSRRNARCVLPRGVGSKDNRRGRLDREAAATAANLAEPGAEVQTTVVLADDRVVGY